MYSSSDLRKGLKVELDNQPWTITEFDFCKPGKGQPLYRCKLKSMITGSTLDRTFRPNDKIAKPSLEERKCQFSYEDGTNFVFSENATFEEITIGPALIGDQKYFLSENAECTILFYNDQPIEITLPVSVEKRIARTEPAVRGDTATNVTKVAVLENGYELQIPLFVNEGDMVKIDTRTGEYVERVRKG